MKANLRSDVPAGRAASEPFDLSLADLRAVAGYAAACALPALALFERARPDDGRPRAAVEAAQAFADGATARTKALRDAAWAAQRAAHEARAAGQTAASEAARAALAAAGAAYLHPLPRATQVGHLLGAAAHAARAFELAAGDAAAAADHLAQAVRLASPVVVAVLRRYPPAPPGGGRPGELLRQLDTALRDLGGRRVNRQDARDAKDAKREEEGKRGWRLKPRASPTGYQG